MPAILPLLLLAILLPSRAAASDVRLVLVLAVDQLRADRLDPGLPGGLGRLAREGRVYTDAVVDHAMSETCPGHAVMLSGQQPAHTGIPANTFIDVENATRVYCVADPAADAAVLGGDGTEGRSPRNFWSSTLGDWMKAADGRSKVYAVAGKDRAAITLAGQRPDGAYWYRRGAKPAFTTSRYYRETLPAWVEAWNGADPPRDGFLAELPERWAHGELPAGLRADDFPGETTRLSRTTSHPLRDADLEVFSEQFYFSPFLDDATLDFALKLVEEEGLGQDEVTDLLGVGLSATDLVGHLYGPFSHESADTLARLDAALAAFLDALEARVGRGRVLVALSSDHGVLPLPEWLAAQEEIDCPESSGRIGLRWLGLGLYWELHRTYSPLFSLPREWIVIAGTQAAVNRPLARERGVAVADVVATTVGYLESKPYIRKVWTAKEIAEGTDELARLYRNSFIPARSGDMAIQLEPECLVALDGEGTTHGTPYLYDRAIPLLFRGPGIEAARIAGPAASVDIGPTLAGQLGLEAPPGLDGRDLIAREAPGPAAGQSSETPSTSR